MATNTIDVNILYDADSFPNICMSNNGTKLTNDDLLINDFYCSELRSMSKFKEFDMGRFTKTFDAIIKKEDILKTIRSVLMIFAVKNMIDITQILGFIITEDIMNYEDHDIEYKDELFSKNHKIFNNIFFNELGKHPVLMLDVIEAMNKLYSKRKTQQYERSYYIIQQIIRTNEESLTPLQPNKLIFIKEGQVHQKYQELIFNTCPIILPFELKYKKYLKIQPPKIRLSFKVDRKNVLRTVWALNSIRNYNGYFFIDFIGESGIDIGGLTKEFVELAFKEIIKPQNDLFDIRNNYYFFRHHNYENEKQKESYKKKYYCIGILFGIVILNKLTIPFHFPPYFYKKLLHRDITLSDFYCFDQELLLYYERMISYNLTEESCVDYVYRDSLSLEEVDLVNFQVIKDDDYVPTPLTDENKDTFINDVLKWVFIISIQDEFDAFEKGFQKVKNDPFFYHAFRLDELDHVVSGAYQRNWDEFKKNARYIGYTSKSKTIVLFWKYFDSLDEEGKLNVMRFIRASTSIPPGGMKDIKITIQKITDKGCPMAHTCNETMDLPEYKTYKELKEKCDLGFSYTDLFGMK